MNKIEELEKLIFEKTREVEYYKKLAQIAGKDRLRETEELSRLNFIIKKKNEAINEQKKELEEKNRKIEALITIDPLTGLLNRRGIMQIIQSEHLKFKRRNFKYKNKTASGEVSCAIFDIDHFKKINDKYGHLTGDKVLSGIGKLLLKPGFLRKTDIVGRFGGEEFILLLLDCSEKSSIELMKKILAEILNMKIETESSGIIGVTVSIGVSSFDKNDNKIESVLYRADEALYFAKEHGRNQVCLYSEMMDKQHSFPRNN